MYKLICILLLTFNSCTSKPDFRDDFPADGRNAKLRILFENSQDNKTTFQLRICKELPDNELKMEKNCELRIVRKLNKNEEVILNLPAGEYYAFLNLSDKKIIPVIVFESTGTTVNFGYKLEDKSNFIFIKHVPEKIDIKNCTYENKTYHRNYLCPKLILADNIQSTYRFKIDSEYEFDGEGTLFIWVGSIWLSVQALAPVPLPLFMGSVAIRRNISNNLK